MSKAGKSNGSGQAAAAKLPPAFLSLGDDFAALSDEENPAEPSDEQRLNILLLFAGDGESAHAIQHILRGEGCEVLAFDIAQGGAAHDATNPHVREHILTLIAAGTFDAIFAAPPCKSFSVRHPEHLRSRARPWGVDPMPAEWSEYISRHNDMAQFALDAFELAAGLGIPVGLEHPADRGDDDSLAHWPERDDRGSIWRAGEAVFEKAHARHFTFAQCAKRIGGAAQKWTTIAATPRLARELAILETCVCCGKRKHAATLSGYDAWGRSRSAQAAAYPPGLAEIIAHALIAAAICGEHSPSKLETDMVGEEPEGRVADGPALGPRARAACEIARNITIPFASPRLRDEAPAAELRAEAFGGNVHEAHAEPPKARRCKALRRRAYDGMSGEEADRTSAGTPSSLPQWLSDSTRSRMARGPIRIDELFIGDVHANEVQPWFILVDKALADIRAGKRPRRVPTVVIGQDRMQLWARGIVWDTRDPNNCLPVEPSTRDTQYPECGHRPDGLKSRQLDRGAFSRVLEEMQWHDEDIRKQAGEGGVEARVDCELATVLAFHHDSLVNEWARAEETVAAHMQEGWVQPPRRTLPFVPCRLQPRGVVMQSRVRIDKDGKPEEYLKPRITTDSSHGGEHSTNAGVPEGERALRLPSGLTFGRGWAIVRSAFTGASPRDGGATEVGGYAVDAEQAYSFCQVQRRDWWTQCFVWFDEHGNAGTAIDERMQFGGSFGPNRFERISTPVSARADRLQACLDEQQPPPLCAQQWSADRRERQQRGELPDGESQCGARFIQSYIDDITGVGACDRVQIPSYLGHIHIPTDHMEAVGCVVPPRDSRLFVYATMVVFALEEVGLSAPPSKIMIGSPVIALGLRFDGGRNRIDCPDIKRLGVMAACDEAAARARPSEGRPTVERAHARRLVGRLCNLSQVAPDIGAVLHAGYAVADPRSGRAREATVGKASIELKEGGEPQHAWLDMLHKARADIEKNEGVPMAPRLRAMGRSAPGSLTSVTDASGDDGVGGYAFMPEHPRMVYMMSASWPTDIRNALAASADEGEAALRAAGGNGAAPWLPMPAAELFGSIVLPALVARHVAEARSYTRVDGSTLHAAAVSVARSFAIGDCMPAAAVLRAMRGRGPQMRTLLASARKAAWSWLGVHVKREANLDGDRLSHPRLAPEVQADAEAAGLTAVWLTPTEADWQLLRDAITAGVTTNGRRRKRSAVRH